MFEEAESRRVFDAAVKNAARGKSDKGGPRCRVDFFGSFFSIKERTFKLIIGMN
jgi:hypothetical protein